MINYPDKGNINFDGCYIIVSKNEDIGFCKNKNYRLQALSRYKLYSFQLSDVHNQNNNITL